MGIQAKRQYMSLGVRGVSPMPRVSEPRRTPTVIVLVMMFLLADLLVPQAVPQWNQLEEQSIVFSVTTIDTAIHDSVISDVSPNAIGNQSESGDMGISEMGVESRLLFTFPMNLTSSDSIQSATLDLECTTESLSTKEIKVYTASTIAWNDSEATWVESDLNTPWDEQGADGASDRSAWERLGPRCAGPLRRPQHKPEPRLAHQE